MSLSLALFAVLAGVVIAAGVTIRQLVDRLRTLERQVITDALTGAFNRPELRGRLPEAERGYGAALAGAVTGATCTDR